MARFVKGEVIIIPFPFSDLSSSKLRPALVLADLAGEDIVLCQITSQKSPKDAFAIPIDTADFATGALVSAGNIRPSRLFTADKNLIVKSVGTIQSTLYQKVVEAITKMIEL